ncbi:hypothetical protein [Spiroplasma alleghenense]|uniref:PvuRts1 I-like SET and RING associated domain-containing protein n=1 Tax=Spiroplasma alleghenense TaxID=216931 RepID=A0A345Z2G2_9MOLU|nr:hypothetical protein [Spiroplasma alleghenense]AXK50791.1 hypothetical protein SALLE_v1c01150 [Spiroplasma alleghenense]
MSNSLIHEIKNRKYITTQDNIVFRTILDVVSSVFTDENKISYITGNYKISENEQVWFPNFVTEKKKELEIEKGYAIYPNKALDTIYKFESERTLDFKKKQAAKQKDLKLAVFGKFFEKEMVIGYHFLGVFVFDSFEDDQCNIMVYKKIADKLDLR